MTSTVQIEILQKAVDRGKRYWSDGDSAGMLNHYLAIRFLFEDAPPEFQRFYFCNLGIAHRENGEVEKAIENYRQALEIEGEESDTATIHANLAAALLYLDHADECLIYLSQSEAFHRVHEPLTGKAEWARRLGNLLETKARALHALGDKNALDVADEAEKLLFKYCRDDRATGRAIGTKSMCWQAGFEAKN